MSFSLTLSNIYRDVPLSSEKSVSPRLPRPGQPNEVAPFYLFLACTDSSYITGQVLHPNGGEPVSS
ncbi:SDR family oxidoreductase [Hoeflea sp.]|uniref:SDR family oxidoreductase n=1 Tax=Hoeflea sp. TaxID=1940281 RepID=UPI003A913E13